MFAGGNTPSLCPHSFLNFLQSLSHVQLCNSTDCSLQGPFVHGISQERMWVTISFSGGSSQARDQTWVSCIAHRFFTTEPPGKPLFVPSAQFSSFQSLSHVRLFVTPWNAPCQVFLSITNSWSLLKLMFIESVMLSNHIILCHPLLLQASIVPSIRVFTNESVLCIRWPKYRSFHFSMSPSSEYSGLISFRMDWFDFVSVQGTVKSLLQHHSSKVSILRCSAFFIVQFPYPYMTTRKIIILTRWTFVGKVMSLLFNMLSRLVIAFLPISKLF